MCTFCIFRKLPEPHCQGFHGPYRAYLLCFLDILPRCSHRLLLALLTSKSNRLKATSSAAQNMFKWFDFLASVKWFLICVFCCLCIEWGFMIPKPLGTAPSFISRSQTGLQAVVARPVTKLFGTKTKNLKIKTRPIQGFISPSWPTMWSHWLISNLKRHTMHQNDILIISRPTKMSSQSSPTCSNIAKQCLSLDLQSPI